LLLIVVSYRSLLGLHISCSCVTAIIYSDCELGKSTEYFVVVVVVARRLCIYRVSGETPDALCTLRCKDVCHGCFTERGTKVSGPAGACILLRRTNVQQFTCVWSTAITYYDESMVLTSLLQATRVRVTFVTYRQQHRSLLLTVWLDLLHLTCWRFDFERKLYGVYRKTGLVSSRI